MAKTALQRRIDQKVAEHGGLRAAARELGIDPAYLGKLRRGLKTSPGDNILRILGLRRVETLKAIGE